MQQYRKQRLSHVPTACWQSCEIIRLKSEASSPCPVHRRPHLIPGPRERDPSGQLHRHGPACPAIRGGTVAGTRAPGNVLAFPSAMVGKGGASGHLQGLSWA